MLLRKVGGVCSLCKSEKQKCVAESPVIKIMMKLGAKQMARMIWIFINVDLIINRWLIINAYSLTRLF